MGEMRGQTETDTLILRRTSLGVAGMDVADAELKQTAWSFAAGWTLPRPQTAPDGTLTW